MFDTLVDYKIKIVKIIVQTESKCTDYEATHMKINSTVNYECAIDGDAERSIRSWLSKLLLLGDSVYDRIEFVRMCITG